MNRFTQPNIPVYDEIAENLFSVQSQFVSQYKDGWKKIKRLNKCIYENWDHF